MAQGGLSLFGSFLAEAGPSLLVLNAPEAVAH